MTRNVRIASIDDNLIFGAKGLGLFSYISSNIVVGRRIVVLSVPTWSQVQMWLKSEQSGNLKISYAILIKSEMSQIQLSSTMSLN